MPALKRFLAMLLADLRERTRSPRFWIMLSLIALGSWYCIPPDEASYRIFSFEQGQRALYSSAWIGMGLSLMLSCLFALVGFFLVRGTLVRDFDTRVWQLLVATPMTRGGFLLAKWASHMMVFAMITIVALTVGAIGQWIRAEDRSIDLFELVKPAILLSLPSFAIVSMLAIWFDMIPWLRRTLGSVLFFILWMSLMGTSLAPLEKAGHDEQKNWRSDPAGMVMIARDINRIRTAQTGVDRGYGFNLGTSRPEVEVAHFQWRTWQPRPMDMAGRLLWLLAAIGGVLAAAPLLDWAAAKTSASDARKNTGSGRKLNWLNRLLRPFQRGPFGTLVAAELKLVLRQRRLWWWLALIGLGIAQLAAEKDGLTIVFCLAWVLPIDILARLALRESESGTAALVFTAPGIVWRLLGVRLLVGLIVSLAVILPGTLRLLVTMPISALTAVLISASFVLWGLALGLLTKNPRLFELAVLMLAYIGINDSPILDIIHAADRAGTWHALGLLPAMAFVLWLWPKLATSRQPH